MAKEIVVWCEIHLQSKEERVPGTEHQIAINGKSVTLDLCDDCRSQYLAPLEEIVETYGAGATTVTAPKKKTSGSKKGQNRWVPDPDGKFRCRAPIEGGGECGREFDTAQAIGRHNLSHGENAA